MNSLAQTLLHQAQALPEGGLLSPGEVAELGTRSAVARALKHLVDTHQLVRVDRGLYTATVEGRFGVRSPAAHRVAEALATREGLALAPHGAVEANALRLSLQVPARVIYLTSGRTRALTLGKMVISFVHAEPWLLRPGVCGAAVRALDCMGPTWIARSVTSLRGTLGEKVWQELGRACEGLPEWIAEAIAAAPIPTGQPAPGERKVR